MEGGAGRGRGRCEGCVGRNMGFRENAVCTVGEVRRNVPGSGLGDEGSQLDVCAWS